MLQHFLEQNFGLGYIFIKFIELDDILLHLVLHKLGLINVDLSVLEITQSRLMQGRLLFGKGIFENEETIHYCVQQSSISDDICRAIYYFNYYKYP